MENDTPTPAGSSLAARLTNVFATPGDVFDEIVAAPPNAWNWLVPMLLNAVFGVVFVLVAFSQPAVLDNFKEMQAKAMQQQVQAGKLTDAQAAQALEGMEKIGPWMYKVGGSIWAVVMSCGMTFLVGLVIWLIADKALKGSATFMKAVEVGGLASVINVLGSIVTLLVVVLKGSITVNLGPVLLFPNLEPGTPAFTALSMLNLVMLWWCAVLSLGTAKLARASFARAAVWIFGIYAALGGVGIAISMLRAGK